MNVADKVALFLADKGCTHAFGIVGSANLPVFYAVSQKLEVISVHHEQAAAMAATYYFRTCGRIAPVLVTAGAGSVNAFTGVMAAQMDSIPLLVISGNEKSDFFGVPHTRAVGFQGFETQDHVRHFTKYAHRPKDGASVIYSLRDAWTSAMKPRRGAAWLDIPQDIAREMVA